MDRIEVDETISSQVVGAQVLAAHVFAVEWLIEVIANATRNNVVLIADGIEQVVTRERLMEVAYQVGVRQTKEANPQQIVQACIRAMGRANPATPPPGGDKHGQN
jgi:uncharacterized protein